MPGLNVAQTSARDVNLTPRLATGRNARATLGQVRLLARTFFARFFESDLMPAGLPQAQRHPQRSAGGPGPGLGGRQAACVEPVSSWSMPASS